MNLLGIYLNDHRAGAVAGLELAKRTLDNNRGTEYEAFLARLVTDIEDDRATLERLIDDNGVPKSPVKPAVAWATERIGRLKLNGALTGYSPLSRLIELEGLRLGVQGKLCLWRSLRHSRPPELEVTDEELDELAARAEAQIEAIEEHRLKAAATALAPAAVGTGD
ncbi:MAG TPA: hypothetical protein VHI71_02025 [Actinomycetota bacterium]|nr:hypothetical protein [Actinomycetota bacterium]